MQDFDDFRRVKAYYSSFFLGILGLEGGTAAIPIIISFSEILKKRDTPENSDDGPVFTGQ